MWPATRFSVAMLKCKTIGRAFDDEKRYWSGVSSDVEDASKSLDVPF